jgi:Regulator of chromosome condensation (RCC1) repeat
MSDNPPKKRKYDVVPISSSPQKENSARRRDPSLLGRLPRRPRNSPFRSTVLKLKKELYRQLNQDLVEKVSNVSGENDDPDNVPGNFVPLMSEYRRQLAVIDELYGGLHGEAVAFGQNEMLQLGYSYANDDEKRKYTYRPFRIKRLETEDIRHVCAGGTHSMALTADGDVYTWGCSDDGVLGRNAPENVGPGPSADQPNPVTGFVNADGTKEDGRTFFMLLKNVSTVAFNMYLRRSLSFLPLVQQKWCRRSLEPAIRCS